MQKVLSIYLLRLFKDNIDKDLDFHMRVRAYEKRVSGKQPEHVRASCFTSFTSTINRIN